jgi:hypothetical protein
MRRPRAILIAAILPILSASAGDAVLVRAAVSARIPAASPTVREQDRQAIRGITIGPIENGYHPDRGYGSTAFVMALEEARRVGATWVALTPFGRVGDLSGLGVDPSFESPFAQNRAAVALAIAQAHALGLRVMLVPHLWVESGAWRALIDPITASGWVRWSLSYGAFLKGWAKVAAETSAELLSVGVELRSWVTGEHAPSLLRLIAEVRALYPGKLTYSANWDDVEDTVIWGALDYIGVNAFFPLTSQEHANAANLREGGTRVALQMARLAQAWGKPVLCTEIGYTTRVDPALRPWEWPDSMKNVKVDQGAQARAYHGLLAPLLDSPEVAGLFVWRTYSDPQDVSQEAEWGFSPRGKRSELVLRDAFSARFAAESDSFPTFQASAQTPGMLPGPLPQVPLTQ